MVGKWMKTGVLGAAGVLLLGGILFGRDLVSYMRTGARSVQSAVKDAVPVEFELRRAKDLLDQIIPEMHANVRIIAQEEVEIAGIKSDIKQSEKSLVDEKKRIEKMVDLMAKPQDTYQLGDFNYSRSQLKEDLARRFDAFKEGEVVLNGKRRLLETRDKSLQMAMRVLDRTRSQKAQLETQIELLESKYRTVKAAAVGTNLQLDNSKLAQTEKLIGEIRKRLDVAERVLAHEAKFVQPIQIDVINE